MFFTLNREDFSFVIHLDQQPRTSRRREAQTGSRARSERTLDAVEHSRTLMEWWPFLIFHRGGLRIKVINNTRRAEVILTGPSGEAIDSFLKDGFERLDRVLPRCLGGPEGLVL